ncbi:cupin domain-containing protein [Rubrivirga sp. S365]|uniref:Cupin domain-containing protein n=1 Tax=Rubrivirga litoralis TaxID=3075598 RepID=A0ABU3BR73_9BACT|nr:MULTISPECIES: cupin domain-containing protein [unclassified Rubrivirga]MDT0631789.1 cupin domain-containing protein [Rubrivirga sp. F394]MDT7856519.1 cupin domain-containing protein [Rubrivirga sp. S365]
MSLDSSTVAPLDRLAPDAPDAVASRVLLKAGGGSATLFSIAEGDGLKEHATPHEALFTVLGGAAEVALGGATHTVRAGEAIRFPARAPHSVRAVSDLRFLLVLLRA